MPGTELARDAGPDTEETAFSPVPHENEKKTPSIWLRIERWLLIMGILLVALTIVLAKATRNPAVFLWPLVAGGGIMLTSFIIGCCIDRKDPDAEQGG